MRGQILDYDAANGAGQISADDGRRYAFRREALRQQVTPWAGAGVDFVPSGDGAADIFVLNNAAAHTYSASSNDIDWGKLFFSADGRITRSRFWIGWGILFGAGIVASIIPFAGFLLIWCNIAVTSKRLHDMGRTGWWQLVPYVLTIVMLVVGIALMASIGASNPGRMTDAQGAAIGIGILAFVGVYAIVSIAFLVWVGATPSDPHTNRFGPPPNQSLASTFD